MSEINRLREEVGEKFLKDGVTEEVLELNRKLDVLVNKEQLKKLSICIFESNNKKSACDIESKVHCSTSSKEQGYTSCVYIIKE